MSHRQGKVADPANAHCSFCGKSRDQVRRLIVGPGVTICDQCVGICNEILAGTAHDRTCRGQD